MSSSTDYNNKQNRKQPIAWGDLSKEQQNIIIDLLSLVKIINKFAATSDFAEKFSTHSQTIEYQARKRINAYEKARKETIK